LEIARMGSNITSPVAKAVKISGVTLEVVQGGEGESVVFLHGSDGMSVKTPFLEGLAEAAHVTAPLHPGFGHSELPSDFKSVDDLAYLYLDMLRELNLSNVTLVGESLGGWIAAEIAVRSTEQISRLVLADSVGVRFGSPTEVDIADLNMLSQEEVVARSYFSAEVGRRDLVGMSDDDLVVMSRNRVAMTQYTWSPYMHNPRLRRWLHRIDVPTLVVWGKQDRIVSPAYGSKLAALIPGSRFVTIDQCGHYPHVERPNELARLVFEFMLED